MVKGDLASGLDPANTHIPSKACVGCVLGKHQRFPFPEGRIRATHKGQLIHADLCGTMGKPTPSGSIYFVLFINDYSGWRFIFLLKQKSEAADRFKELIHTIRGETGHVVRTLRTDNRGEWYGIEFTEWMKHKGICHETTASRHTPEHDGVAERYIRTVTEGHAAVSMTTWNQPVYVEKMLQKKKTESLVKDCRVPLYMWGEAASYTVYT